MGALPHQTCGPSYGLGYDVRNVNKREKNLRGKYTKTITVKNELENGLMKLNQKLLTEG